MNTINRIETWYHSSCDGDWEHTWGIKVETVDNPGWKVEIDLKGTILEEKQFKEVSYGIGDEAEESGHEWILCKVERSKFYGVGGPRKLDEILSLFLNWAETEPVAGGDATR